MDTEHVLSEAKETGEVISIIYHGGSKPGTVRNIAVISISGDKYRARCYDTNSVKTFLIDKTEILAKDSPELHHRSERDLIDDSPTLGILFKKIETALISMGWTPEFENNHLALYRSYKNGKRLKRPSAAIYYDPVAYTYERDPETREQVSIPHQTDRVWHTFTNQGNRSFKHFDKAARYFIDRIKEAAPIQENRDQLLL